MTENSFPFNKAGKLALQMPERESIVKLQGSPSPSHDKRADNSVEIFNLEDVMLQRDKSPEVTLDPAACKKIEDTNIEFMTPAIQVRINLKSVQRQFIRKVLVILGLQFLISILMITLAIVVAKFNKFIFDHLYLVAVACVAELGFFIALICFRPCCKRVPHNYFLLFFFTFSMSYLLCFLCVIVSKVAVLIASVSTGCLVFGLALFSVCSNRDLTNKIALIIYVPIAGMLIIIFASAFPIYITQLFVSLVIVMIFGLYLVYDIQKLLGRFEDAYTIDDYIIAALEIYVDIVFIFKELLIMVGSVATK